MRIRQLFDPDSSSYSYLLWDADSRQAALIDPVCEQAGRDIALVRELGLSLKYTLDTHLHADHITGSGYLRALLDSLVIMHECSHSKYADVLVRDGDFIPLGRHRITVIHTPGHTDGHMCLAIPDAVFTGDSLLINGCGRTDYLSGDPGLLYDSITQRLFTLPDDTLIYPGHDYEGRFSSSIGREKAGNRRINSTTTRDEFVTRMNGLRTSMPARMQEALPSNLRLGLPVTRVC